MIQAMPIAGCHTEATAHTTLVTTTYGDGVVGGAGWACTPDRRPSSAPSASSAMRASCHGRARLSTVAPGAGRR
jgi:hypothetical protein